MRRKDDATGVALGPRDSRAGSIHAATCPGGEAGMRRDPRVRSWERVRVERRQRAVAQLWRLRRERMTRTAGTFHGTRATACGDMQSGPELSDPSRVLLALVLFVAVAAVTL